MQRIAAVMLILAVLPLATRADEQAMESRITSVDLFKNGLSVVKRTLTIPAPGVYRIQDVPVPVHGTFWIESDAEIVTQLTQRVVEVPAGSCAGGDFQEDLAGREVLVHFTDGRTPPASGRVVAIDPAVGEDAWSRTYQPPRYGHYGNWEWRPSPWNRFLVLETDGGRSYVDSSRIACLEAKGAGKTIRQRRPVLLISARKMKRKPATVEISYLSKGIAWAPSYRVDISNTKVLAIRQKTVIKNELEDISDADLQLISGFPSVQFAHVTSPLSLGTTWASFFGQLNQRRRAGHPSLSNVVTQQAISFNAPAPAEGIDLSAVPSGEGVDLHYQAIGRQTLAEGDSLALDVASAEAPYERIVEWVVPDTRRANGQYISDHERNTDPEKYQDAAWDAVRFKNPLPFPMTTAPAMIVCDGRFNGQRMSYWVNRGEQTTLHVTKALSVRTRSLEQEEPTKREEIYLGGERYYKAIVKGELWANNHRKESIPLVIRRRFSGDLLQADKSPDETLLEEGVYSVNRRNQLTWSLTLKPAEEVKLTYRYSVLVRR